VFSTNRAIFWTEKLWVVWRLQSRPGLVLLYGHFMIIYLISLAEVDLKVIISHNNEFVSALCELVYGDL
jgi:hypothetical protein